MYSKVHLVNIHVRDLIATLSIFVVIVAVMFGPLANNAFTAQLNVPPLPCRSLVENVNVWGDDGKLLLHQLLNFEETNCVSLCLPHCSVALLFI